MTFVGQRVRTTKKIDQPPRSKDPAVPRGTIGLIEDYLGPEGSFMVDFEAPYGVLECYWDEITLAGPARNPGPSFDEIRKAMPRCVGGYDPMSHKMVNDLVWLARHELDLYQEGEETDIRTSKQAQAVRSFIQKFGPP